MDIAILGLFAGFVTFVKVGADNVVNWFVCLTRLVTVLVTVVFCCAAWLEP